MNTSDTSVYEFGSFRLDPSERLLFHDGRVVPLKPKVFDTLLILARGRGRVLSKEELMRALWPDTVVEENNLNQNIAMLRRALGEGVDGVKYIETIPRRGYRLAPPVREVWKEHGAPDSGRAPAAVVADGEHTAPSAAGTASPQSVEGPAPAAAYEPAVSPVRPPACVKKIGWLAAGLLAGLAGSAWYFHAAGPGPVTRAGPAEPSLAVLPLANFSGDPAQEYFNDGLTEALITDLARGGGVRVISRASVMRFKGNRPPARGARGPRRAGSDGPPAPRLSLYVITEIVPQGQVYNS